MPKSLKDTFKKSKEITKKIIKPKEIKPLPEKPLIEDEKQEQTANDILKEIFASSGAKGGITDEDVKDIESIKLIISSILNDDLLESLTNLDADELDDLCDAFYLNEFADNPRLYIYIIHRLKLSRSKVFEGKSNNLLTIFADISGKGLTQKMNDATSSILGNRFK
jgi:hypothetical protein